MSTNALLGFCPFLKISLVSLESKESLLLFQTQKPDKQNTKKMNFFNPFAFTFLAETNISEISFHSVTVQLPLSNSTLFKFRFLQFNKNNAKS